jgi:hypothetical protein
MVSLCYRISLLAVSVSCVVFTLGLVGYVYQHRKIKVFKVASPIFLGITLLGCAIMYLEVHFILNLWFRTAGKRSVSVCVILMVILWKFKKNEDCNLIFYSNY